ncbi:unnamed protein product [Withania somnifera]
MFFEDAYGFAVRPQHVQRYREYVNIYKEEEEERSDRWKDFLERQAESADLPINGIYVDKSSTNIGAEPITQGVSFDAPNGEEGQLESTIEKDDTSISVERKNFQAQIWTEIRPSLRAVADMMSTRVKKKVNLAKKELDSGSRKHLPAIEESRPTKGLSEEDSEDEFYDMERSESLEKSELGSIQDIPLNDTVNHLVYASQESLPSWKEELECLVQGGVPMALRGELWQVFVGVRARRLETYYQDLLVLGTRSGSNNDLKVVESEDYGSSVNASMASVAIPEKWRGQIEKDLPRTFPGHPALDEDGRNALRRLLTAYAQHNPSVGYCQAMNFFAALLLLLMPEENAFWTLMGILDDYFDGYYSEEMVESQVDQIVLEELVQEKFPKLVSHLDYLGVQVAWVTGPWFLSIFMNMLPWESVLRVWDVLLFEGNRAMLFHSALALMELYGPALVTTKDAGDAVTLLQSLAGSTFDSSQLVLTACMGYQNVNEARLEVLRNKHRPAVKAALEERSTELRVLRNSQGLVTKLYSFKHDSGSAILDATKTDQKVDTETNSDASQTDIACANMDELYMGLNGSVEIDSVPDLQEKAEQLEQEVAELRQVLADKQEQENAMLEEKYEEAIGNLAEMEKRLVMAESMLEATLQYQSGQNKVLSSPRSTQKDSSPLRGNQDSSPEIPARKISLLSRPFGLGWRDKNKGKPAEEVNESKLVNEEIHPNTQHEEMNDHQMEEKLQEA